MKVSVLMVMSFFTRPTVGALAAVSRAARSWRELPSRHGQDRTLLQDRAVAEEPRLRQLRGIAGGARRLAGDLETRPAVPARPDERAYRLRRVRERLPLL